MKAVTPREFLEQWADIVMKSIAPPTVLKIKGPHLVLNLLADNLPAHRERLKIEIDTLVEQVLVAQSDQDLETLLLKTDPEIFALYWDRIVDAGKRLRAMVHLNERFENPEST